MNLLNLICRDDLLFEDDLTRLKSELINSVQSSSFLVIGGAGSIGQAVVREIFKRDPKTLHVVDISENNMVELVRDIRSTLGYIKGEFKTFAIDCGSPEFEALFAAEGPYDYILNLSALKHVRSEKDPYTLMRMIKVNIFNTIKTLSMGSGKGLKNYFCVSTDKAANPVNMMGGSKRIMEMFLMRESLSQNLSMARFANVAFSDGSLLHGFNQRFSKMQPIAAPNDVKRYFVTPQESGELCLMSCIFGENRDVFFPKLSDKLHLVTFSEIARKYLQQIGYDAYECETEGEARDRCSELISEKKWPCYFFNSDTTGEKDFEEFFTEKEELDMNRFSSIGVIKNDPVFDQEKLASFETLIDEINSSQTLKREDFVNLFHEIIPDFGHKETGKFLDQRM
ncbi:UDP-N-acetylglucosamine 4,6-dehydratase [Verrucomicrobia bacterium]|nr:UDP-N-acetylglucosamine 4,6-dehydratase [Verrucomicrobiota bacterium]